LEGFGLPDPHVELAQVPVVAKRLSPSDVLVKVCRDGLMFYSHRRFGRQAGAERAGASHQPGWFPVQGAIPVAEIAIAMFESGENKKAPRHFGPANYSYRELARY
jgi:hypothetical protein